MLYTPPWFTASCNVGFENHSHVDLGMDCTPQVRAHPLGAETLIHELHISPLSHDRPCRAAIWREPNPEPSVACLAAMSKSMLVERLREAEDRLLTARQEETMSTLVQTKIKLAQADYVNLELQVTGVLI